MTDEAKLCLEHKTDLQNKTGNNNTKDLTMGKQRGEKDKLKL